MRRRTTLGLATSLHLALFALVAKPVDPGGWLPSLALGGASAAVLAATLFAELSAGGLDR